eukprot:COSAG02_NODE_837_length_16637_cov_5.797859_8_plen_65_part_00
MGWSLPANRSIFLRIPPDHVRVPGYCTFVSVDLRIYRAFFRTQAMNAEYIDNLDNIGTKTQTRD